MTARLPALMSETGIAGLRRRAAGFAGDRHQPAEALRDQVEAALVGPRTVAAEAGDRAVDEAGVGLGQHVVAEPQLLHRAGAVVLRQHVGVAHHPQQDVLALRVLQVQGDAALVAVHHQERRRHAVDARLAVAARVVAAGQLLDLDDVGAHVGEHQPGGRAGHDLREFEHAQAGERARVRRALRRRVLRRHRVSVRRSRACCLARKAE